MGVVVQPLRVALIGRAESPGIGLTLELVGCEKSLARIGRAIDYVNADG